MCRHLAYLGPEIALGEVLTRPPHSLYQQSWAPRRQRYGTVNADGFGVGWYAPGDPVPARYRRSGPIWADLSVMDLARVVRSGALLGAVRDATEAGADGEAAAAPFADGPWLFSHNGALLGWPDSAARLAAGLPAAELLGLAARCDSAFVWALVRHRLNGGDTAAEALTETVAALAAAAPGSRLNLLVTDGETITATAWGDTLWYLAAAAPGRRRTDAPRTDDRASALPAPEPTAAGPTARGPMARGPAVGGPGQRVVVASEPYDDDPRWHEVPDRTLLTASRTDVLLTPLKEPCP